LQYNTTGCDEEWMLEQAANKEMLDPVLKMIGGWDLKYNKKDDMDKEELAKYRESYKNALKRYWGER
jgi:hypothetical protein